MLDVQREPDGLAGAIRISGTNQSFSFITMSEFHFGRDLLEGGRVIARLIG